MNEGLGDESTGSNESGYVHINHLRLKFETYYHVIKCDYIGGLDW
jgi:hypothetical protein